MKILGIIPARYASSRLPGKPLADIEGKPMVWWVYNQVIKVKQFESVFVATDDKRIADYCVENDIPYVMTSSACPNHIHRIWEVSNQIEADYYVSVNGDEPLIEPANIIQALPEKAVNDSPYFGSVYRKLTDPAETMDLANVKIVLDKNNDCLYQSRTPIPYPKGSILFEYKKAIGIECFNKKALDAFASLPMGVLEKIEDIDHLRFLENGIKIHYEEIESESLSVDTMNDLEKVRRIIRGRQNEKYTIA
jgi:3-deoxy-manno-octulosonate cytidylyltransferase (CMP-KDO synthetase)